MPHIDVLFLKHDQRHAKLEELVKAETAAINLKFASLPMLQATEKDLGARVFFYAPPDPTTLQAQLQLEGLHNRNPHEAIVVVYEQSLEEQIQGKISGPGVFFARSDSNPQQVHFLFDQLKKYLRPASPLAFVISARESKAYRDALQDAGFSANCIEGEQFPPGEIAHFNIDKENVSLVVLEGDHIKSLAEVVESNFPNARIVGVGDDTHQRNAYSRGFIFYKRDHQIGKTLREFARREFAKRQITSDQAASPGTVGTCYILAGPTSAGKTEAGVHIQETAKEFKRDVYVIKKHTTRARRPDEEPYKHMVFKTRDQMNSIARGRKYFMTYNADNNRYGVPVELQETLNRGDDAILTWTDSSTLPALVDNLERRIGPGVAVPILFYADSNTLKARLINRPANVAEKERRFPQIDAELARYLDPAKLAKYFKYVINTSHYQDTTEIKRLLKAILHWEIEHKNKNYYETVIRRVFPPDFFARVVHSQPITLEIPDQVMHEYSAEKGIPLRMFNSFQRQKVICVSEAYGRVGIWMAPPPDIEKRYQGRDVVLDLIERTIQFEPRYRNNHRNLMHYSIWAKCGDTLTVFNDGLLYMLGDDLYERPMAGGERYAVSFGFMKTRGKFFRALPLRPGEIEALQSEMQRMNIFPLAPRGD
jgi:guanylate kinase